MKKYSSYKESGLELIDEIPKHWVTKRLQYVSKIENSGIWGEDEKFDSSIKVLIPTTGQLSKEGVWDYDNMSERFISLKDWEYYKCLYGDIIVVKSSGSSTNIITGKCGFIDDDDSEKFTFSNFLLRVRPKTIQPKFLYFFLSSNITKQRIEKMVSSTTYPNLKVDEYNKSEVPYPPLPEQKKIVSFLDEKTTKIDQLIQSKQRKIELLKEKRTSLINEIVTKGLNPDVEMKGSGVEWIGEIPSHWENSKLGFYTSKIGSGSTPRGGSEVYVDSGIPFVRSQNVHFSGLDLSDVSYITPDIHNSMSNTIVQKNDVLLNITGGSIGRCCLVNIDTEMNVNQHVSILRTKESVLPNFLNYLLGSDVGQLQVYYNISGGNREGLTIDGISNFRITIPPLKEQQEIIEYLDSETQTIDITITLEEEKISLLKEYKQSLISEVVTGKVNVQDEVTI